jgi:glycosyltransferase involved in cell wall biosynthesis
LFLKIVAGLIVRDEADRYLRWSLDQLLGFCHTVVVLDDGSTDSTADLLAELQRSTVGNGSELVVARNNESVFFQHEGRARQTLMDMVLEQSPTHILCTDADEVLSNTRAVWQAVLDHWENTDRQFRVWTLPMQEVWKADENNLWLRVDGGWRAHGVPVLYSVPDGYEKRMRIQDKALACGRQPEMVNREALARRSVQLPSEVLHFGWTRVAEREARYQRYAVADGGKFHRNSHLESIMWDDRRVRLERRKWPEELFGMKPLLLGKVNS